MRLYYICFFSILSCLTLNNIDAQTKAAVIVGVSVSTGVGECFLFLPANFDLPSSMIRRYTATFDLLMGAGLAII